jgi:demethylspheroidene O-methyltransferase
MDLRRRLRDRWLSKPEVRARLGRLPIGRAIADRHAQRLFAIVAGFAQSQMLAAGVELGLFERLAGGPLSRPRLREALALPERGFDALIQALVATGLIEERRSGLALTIDGWVVATDPGLTAMIAHNALLYRDLADPGAMLRRPGEGALAAFWPYRNGQGAAAGYSDLMAQSSAMVADALLATVDFARFDCVMDIGGGDGSFLARIAPITSARLVLVDLPDVIARARDRLAPAESRIEFFAVSEGAPLPTGADAVTFLRVLHDHDDAGATALLAAARAALAPGGRAIIAEPVARPAPDPQAAYFAAYFAAMGSGKLRTRNDLVALLKRSGLAEVRGGQSTLLCDVILARQT